MNTYQYINFAGEETLRDPEGVQHGPGDVQSTW